MTARPSSRAQRARDPLELVSLRQLRYFSAAMRAPSFNEAARECSISQPALSEQIALLEQVLGVPLFDRTGGRAVPTLSGHELERRIAGSLLELQSALREVPERADTISGLVPVLRRRPRLAQHVGPQRPLVQRQLDRARRGPVPEAGGAG
ncbi:LysR family transcriptional regulator, partial [Variovorax paradoxus]|uniref:LysR family transcriptional regulator n=1 Tax=Variovorax paradoxus TaxID=34073 RepID=UPI001ABC3FE3